jgi:hypothetical protein
MVHKSVGKGVLNVSFVGTALCFYKLAMKPTRNATWWKLKDEISERLDCATCVSYIGNASHD